MYWVSLAYSKLFRESFLVKVMKCPCLTLKFFSRQDGKPDPKFNLCGLEV